jgi:hypothetical protein
MLMNPEWEEREMREQQAREAELQPLDIRAPGWWNPWQTFVSELQETGRAQPDQQFTIEDLEIAYARAWHDTVKAIEAAITAATKGE